MELLWWIDEPFREKLFFFLMMGGIAFLMNEIFNILQGWNKKLDRFYQETKESYLKDKDKSKALIQKWRKINE
ncbi:MAG: hypothetical protein A2161_17930 [Candidatus Schekmanbacteria bacterium RBG_13_48_7]|uniref:Uncharacterized protein n=1 Tax=Candidatus Schekmanbacteria bacterium RBG_13_48_7 TaxID=1817878 RepID=A0A1F7RXQ8_9BACT|nr:MAG: hypothetical protein A2161_17930 [Candidatus Schekmanbacteria bacterium RBG_13_48_7]